MNNFEIYRIQWRCLKGQKDIKDEYGWLKLTATDGAIGQSGWVLD